MLLVKRPQKPLSNQLQKNNNEENTEYWDELRASTANKEKPMGCVITSSGVATSIYT